MILMYLFALLPIMIGAFLWVTRKEITIHEWLIGSGVALLVSVMIHVIAIIGLTADEEIWSGRVTKVIFYPEWIEEYQQMHTRTVGSGKNQHTEIYFTTEHRTHYEHWCAVGNYGTYNEEFNITKGLYEEIGKNFGGVLITTKPYKSGFDGGDRNVYHYENRTGYLYPLCVLKQWENKIKAAPTVFSFQKVPENAKLFEYPTISNKQCTRNLGVVGIETNEWSKMCSRLGPYKKVNMIILGFGKRDIGQAMLQEAKWLGGKKNDLVICFGGENPEKAEWSYVFGWTESENVKRNLEDIMLKNDINNSIIEKIEQEVQTNYIIKDWKKFDYISVEPPIWSYVVLAIVMILSQISLYIFFYSNEVSK